MAPQLYDLFALYMVDEGAEFAPFPFSLFFATFSSTLLFAI
jgi:hypothetical protein